MFKTYFKDHITELYKTIFLGFPIVNNGISAYTITMAQGLFPAFKCLIKSVKCSSPPNPNLISF